MPVSTFMGLQTSLRGLLAHQRALDTTGHNVANADSVGYSRQEVVTGAAPALSIAAGALASGAGAQVGTGVDVVAYRRIRDGFLDLQYRAQNTALGDAATRTRSLDQLELSLNEPGTGGLAHELGKLFSSFSNLANAPESIPGRQALVDQAKTVAAAFAEVDAQMATVREQAATELAALAHPTTGKVAMLAKELASVGEAIRAAYTASEQPNDLLDKRDLLLDQLSELGQVSVAEYGDGGVKVLLGGEVVVDDRPTPATAPRVQWDGTPSAAVGGKLGALAALSAPGGIVDGFRAELAGVASALAAAVNDIHDDGPNARPFFAFDAARGASGLTVAVTAGQVEPGSTAAAGRNDIALRIAALRGGAVEQAYGAFVGRVGSEVRLTGRQEANAEALLSSVEDRRQGTSGVSLDEEMTNLVRFQRGYQASARAMTTLDEMIDVLINRTGRVGL